jgi:hypothetical protein
MKSVSGKREQHPDLKPLTKKATLFERFAIWAALWAQFSYVATAVYRDGSTAFHRSVAAKCQIAGWLATVQQSVGRRSNSSRKPVLKLHGTDRKRPLGASGLALRSRGRFYATRPNGIAVLYGDFAGLFATQHPFSVSRFAG